MKETTKHWKPRYRIENPTMSPWAEGKEFASHINFIFHLIPQQQLRSLIMNSVLKGFLVASQAIAIMTLTYKLLFFVRLWLRPRLFNLSLLQYNSYDNTTLLLLLSSFVGEKRSIWMSMKVKLRVKRMWLAHAIPAAHNYEYFCFRSLRSNDADTLSSNTQYIPRSHPTTMFYSNDNDISKRQPTMSTQHDGRSILDENFPLMES